MSDLQTFRRRRVQRIFVGLCPAGRVQARAEYRFLRRHCGLSPDWAKGVFERTATLLRDYPAEGTP